MSDPNHPSRDTIKSRTEPSEAIVQAAAKNVILDYLTTFPETAMDAYSQASIALGVLQTPPPTGDVQ